MNLTSVFQNGETIPSEYTCDGENISPELIITNIPTETKSLALVVDDPDAPFGTFTHWLLYNISPDTTKISSKTIPANSLEGETDFGRTGYGGPCPPTGNHRYFFKLYAINKTLDLPARASKKQLEDAIKNNIVEKTELIGLYSRKKH